MPTRSPAADAVPGPLLRAGTAVLRLARCRPGLVDAALALAMVVGGIAGLLFDVRRDPSYRSADPLAYLLVVLGSLPYLARRRAPLAVLVAAAVPVVALIELGYPSGVLGAGLFVAAYSVAAWRGRRQILVAAGTVLAALLTITLLFSSYRQVSELGVNIVLFTGAFLLGDAAKTRRRYVTALEERTALAEREAALAAREREQARQRAVSEERVRIAQELHDIVAHSMGVIALQAGVGAHVIDSDPAEARESLLAISHTSRETLGEIRRILGALRGPDGEAAYAPAPGLADLDALTGTVTAAGVPVTVRIEGHRTPLPAGVDLTAYRIVQEALTNVVRHAGPARAEVVVRYRPGVLHVEVHDDGHGPVADHPAEGGHGLLGMRERVGMWGGTLVTGARDGGGFSVTAHLPYGDPAVQQEADQQATGQQATGQEEQA